MKQGHCLLVGTGKYRDFDQTRDAIERSGAEIVTVAIRRANIGRGDEPNLLDVLLPGCHAGLADTVGCHTMKIAGRGT